MHKLPLQDPDRDPYSVFRPQTISNALWSLGSLSHRHEPMLKALVPCCMEKLSVFSHQEFSNICLGYAYVDYYDPSFMLAIETEFDRGDRADGFIPQAICNIFWSFCNLRYFPTKALPKILRYLNDRIGSFSIQVRL